MQKDRVQLFNPHSKRWVKINTAKGGIIGYKDTPWSNVRTVEERKASPEYKRQLEIDRIIKTHKFKIDPKYARQHIRCDCGHYSKDHYLGEGCCKECGCTWYWPNHRWIQKQQIKQATEILKAREDSQ